MKSLVRVAVVDGNPVARQGLIQRLQRMPEISVVGEAGNPGEALAVVNDRKPDVVVVDLRRLTQNAAGFLNQLAGSAPEAGIVVLTAYLTDQERADLTGAGAQAILFKEIDSDTLVRTIQTVADQGATLAD